MKPTPPQTESTPRAAEIYPDRVAMVHGQRRWNCAQLNERAQFLVVVNRVGTPGRGELAFQRLTEVARQHVGVQLHYLGEIPDDDAVMQHRLGQLPLVATDAKAPTSAALAAMVERLGQACGGLRAREVPGDQGIDARFRQHRLFL